VRSGLVQVSVARELVGRALGWFHIIKNGLITDVGVGFVVVVSLVD